VSIKRALLRAFVLLAIFVLFGCSSQGAGPSQKQGPYTIGYDVYWLGNSWSVQLAEEFKAAVEKNKGDIQEIVYTQSDNQPDKQVSNIQSMIAKKVDAIIMTPISPAAAVPVIKQAEQANIPVILLGATADTEDYTSLVTVDDTEFGRVGAKWLAEELNGKGNIYVLNGVAGIATHDQRFAGATSVFKDYPDINIVAEENADWDDAKAKTVTATMLAAHPDVDGVWSQGGSMTLGAIEAFENAGKPLVPMTGEDNNGFLKKWQQLKQSGNENFDSIGVAKPTWLAESSLETTLKILKGQDYKKDNIMPPPRITSENLDEYVRPDLPDSFWTSTHLSDERIKKLYE
jgi:ribose transport system substrate-binding protein